MSISARRLQRVQQTTPSGSVQGPVSLSPIDGGPTYYGDHGFSYATAWGATLGFGGFDDPDFFPISVWMVQAYTQSDLTRLVNLHINGITAAIGNTDYDYVRNAGVWTTVETTSTGFSKDADNPTNPGAETVGLVACDEPQDMNIVYNAIANAPSGIKANRFWYTNYTDSLLNGDLQYTWFPPDMVAAQDLCSQDLYCFTDYLYSAHKLTNMRLYPVGRDATDDERKRGSHYGSMVDSIRKNYSSVSARAPIGNFIENGGPMGETQPYISPLELKWAVWAEIVHGGRNILYFNHSFEGPAQSNDNLGNAYYSNPANYPAGEGDIYSATQDINAKVLQMAPFLNSPFDGYCCYGDVADIITAGFLTNVTSTNARGWDQGVDASCHWHATSGKHYIVASTRESKTTTNIPAVYHIAGNYTGVAHELFDNYDVTITGGTFSDPFATGASLHAYRID